VPPFDPRGGRTLPRPYVLTQTNIPPTQQLSFKRQPSPNYRPVSCRSCEHSSPLSVAEPARRPRRRPPLARNTLYCRITSRDTRWHTATPNTAKSDVQKHLGITVDFRQELRTSRPPHAQTADIDVLRPRAFCCPRGSASCSGKGKRLV
jgi:hypothetical protein